jgi:hypothetical protein
MTTYVYRNGKLVDKNTAPPRNSKLGKASFVISDEMPETRHMADGKYYTSKAKFREATRAAGCVEVGNETSTLLKPRKPIELDRNQRREHIRQVINDLRNR